MRKLYRHKNRSNEDTMVSKDTKMIPQETNFYVKPPSMSTSQSVKTFIYNRETGAFMGRTASSWGKSRIFGVTEKKVDWNLRWPFGYTRLSIVCIDGRIWIIQITNERYVKLLITVVRTVIVIV